MHRIARFSTGFIYEFPNTQPTCEIFYFGGDGFQIDEEREIVKLRWTQQDMFILNKRLDIRDIDTKNLPATLSGTNRLYDSISKNAYTKLGSIIYHQLQYSPVVSVEVDY
jgi:hypothetical protein